MCLYALCFPFRYRCLLTRIQHTLGHCSDSFVLVHSYGLSVCQTTSCITAVFQFGGCMRAVWILRERKSESVLKILYHRNYSCCPKMWILTLVGFYFLAKMFCIEIAHFVWHQSVICIITISIISICIGIIINDVWIASKIILFTLLQKCINKIVFCFQTVDSWKKKSRFCRDEINEFYDYVDDINSAFKYHVHKQLGVWRKKETMSPCLLQI